jgi:ribosomal protein S12 methylthiotransferase
MPCTQSLSGPTSGRTVALITLGCARNEVDSEELAGALRAAGWTLVDDAADADVALVNTCGFVEQAKKDSIDTVLEAADLKDDDDTRTRAVVAVGCLAERYGRELAEALPEADAILGFDSYTAVAGLLDGVLRGERPQAHLPRDRRTLLPVTPVSRRPEAPSPPTVRARLDTRCWAPVRLASGCDRRCAFCAIPAFRGAFTSRPAEEVIAEASWLVGEGVKEVLLVSENSTSYGKDLGDARLLESLLPRLAGIPGMERVRVSYLQPAEVRPSLIETIASAPGVTPYFDLSFQHSAPGILRRMRRFGGTGEFLALIEKIRSVAPAAGIRSNVIVGFPGETEEDLAELERFLTEAMLDVVGVFGYSDEDGTEAFGFDGKHPADVVAARATRVRDLVEELTAQRAADRVGQTVEVLVESLGEDADDLRDVADPLPFGRAAHQGPDVDGVTFLSPSPGVPVRVGDVVTARVVRSEGVDLVAAAGPFPGPRPDRAG